MNKKFYICIVLTIVKIEKMKQILTRYGEVKALQGIFGVSRPTVISALKGRTLSDLARKIRNAALERGGKETD